MRANEELARKAVGIILAFLQKEGPPAEIGELMAALPGAAELGLVALDLLGELAPLVTDLPAAAERGRVATLASAALRSSF